MVLQEPFEIFESLLIGVLLFQVERGLPALFLLPMLSHYIDTSSALDSNLFATSLACNFGFQPLMGRFLSHYITSFLKFLSALDGSGKGNIIGIF